MPVSNVPANSNIERVRRALNETIGAVNVHSHPISQITNLQSTLDGKAATSHTHAISAVTGLQSALDGKQAVGSYAAATHAHAISDVTGLQTALDDKVASTQLSVKISVGTSAPVSPSVGDVWIDTN